MVKDEKNVDYNMNYHPMDLVVWVLEVRCGVCAGIPFGEDRYR